MQRLLAFAVLCVPLSAASPEYERALDLYSHTDYQASLQLLLPAQEKTAAQQVLIGQNYFMLGDAKRAVEFFQQAVAREPNNSVYCHWLGRAFGRRAEMGNPFAALGYASKARQNFEKAVELDPNNSEAANDLFEFYLQAPGFIGGGMDKAVKMADRIAEMNAAEGNYARARIEEKRKDYHRAEQHLRRAMEMAPRQVGRVIDLAKFLAKRGRFEESEQAFVAAEKLDPRAPKVLYARAATYIETGRNLDTARELLEKYLASSLTPDDPSRAEAEKLLRQASGG
jgi:tetratricopeptide (TPR) repeat protein